MNSISSESITIQCDVHMNWALVASPTAAASPTMGENTRPPQRSTITSVPNAASALTARAAAADGPPSNEYAAATVQ